MCNLFTCSKIWALGSGIHESLQASWQTSELNLHNMAKSSKLSPHTMLHNNNNCIYIYIYIQTQKAFVNLLKG